MAGPLIEFVCVATAHRPYLRGEHASTVTVHEGRWAYCDSPAEEGHDWAASDGLPFSEAMRFTPRQQAILASAGPAAGLPAAAGTAAPAASAPATTARARGRAKSA